MSELVKIYCINVETSIDRKKRMIHRFETAGILDKVTFVQAIPSKSSLVDYYIGYNDNKRLIDQVSRNVVSCRASHLKAIKQFLNDSESLYKDHIDDNCVNDNYAIICEDDIMLDNNFVNRYHQIVENIPNNAPIICLSYLMWNYDGIKWSGKDHKKENICNIGKDTWGAQMYMISKEYAMKVLEKFDKPNTQLKEYEKTGEIITSELPIRISRGYIAYPPLAIEDCIFSNIAYVDHNKSNHVQAVKGFGYQNYNKGELDESTPLCNYP